MNDLIFRAPWLIATARVFAEAGQPLYAVGGVVRNALMGLPASDVDVCGPAKPEQVARLCEGTPVRAVLRASHFGTVELHAEDAFGRHMAEYTTFRVDSYRCGHKPSSVCFADSPAVDALRRDFSVNALYRPLLTDPDAPVTILDPTGGLAHLRQGILHTVTENPDLVFKDDGLRILRAARFQAELGLRPTPVLLLSAAKYSTLLNDIACERLRDELTRLLVSDTKYPMLSRTEPPVSSGLATVRAIHAWQALFGTLLPDEAGIVALDAYHAPDRMPLVSGRLATLFYREMPQQLADMMVRLHYSVRETDAARQALTAMQAILSGQCTLMDAVRFGTAPIAHAAASLAALQGAGVACGTAFKDAQELLQALSAASVPKSLKALAINGNDLLPLCRELNTPSSAIGRVLDTLWQAVVLGELPNERTPMLSRARQLLAVETEN